MFHGRIREKTSIAIMMTSMKYCGTVIKGIEWKLINLVPVCS